MTTIEPSILTVNPAWDHQASYVRQNAKRCKHTLRGGEGTGLTVLICGAGPSLKDSIDRCVEDFQPDAVWGCNSALRWLTEHQKPVSHGVAIAPEDGLIEDWKPFPAVQYYVGSGVCPVVTKILSAKHRKMSFFHMIYGLPGVGDEALFYASLFPPALCVKPTGGFNVTNIAVCLAIGMGFETIVVAGADCCLTATGQRPDPSDPNYDALNLAWKARQVMYVDGRDAVSAYGPNVVLADSGGFVSRPDMLLSAVHLVDLAKHYPGKIVLAGDTLPNYLLRTPESQWRDKMPKVANGVITNFQPIVSQSAMHDLAQSIKE